MARKWTDEQLSAIDTRDKTLLVSAAAGSGKTATLTERIIRSLLDESNPADISKMIIVTFTRAAAQELRERISAALSRACEENPTLSRLRRQLLFLPSAKICTIDSFCADIVRQYATKVGVRADFRVCDENERALLCRDIMEELIEQCYGGVDASLLCAEKFCEMADSIVSAKRGEELGAVLLSIYEKMISHPDRIGVLDRAKDNFLPCSDFFSTKSGALIKDELRGTFEHFEKIYAYYMDEILQSGDEKVIANHYPAYDDDLRFMRAVSSSLLTSDYTSMRTLVTSHEKKKLGAVRGELPLADEKMKQVRESFYKQITQIKDKYFSYSQDELDVLEGKAFDFCDALRVVLAEFDLRFGEEKRRRGICDYGDLEYYALQILYDGDKPSDVAKNLQKGFDYVYIDEYQDVNSVQHAIFSAISREDNCFMVGDIKQSIYSFRHAEPDIFAGMKKTLPKLSEDKTATRAGIFMSNNFRCDRTVVNFINSVFDRVFGVTGDSIGYESDDALVFSKLCDPSYVGAIPEIVMMEKLASSPDDEDEEDTDEGIGECEYVAKRIKDLLDSGTLENGERIKPNDIAILLRAARSKAPLYAEALKKYGIPCDTSEQQSFFESPEVLLVLCILNTVDNPQKDIYLAGTLHSPVYNFSLDELIAIRRSVKEDISLYDALCVYCDENPNFEKGKYFLCQLERFRLKSRGCPVDRLIEYIYSETALLSMFGESSETGHSRLLCLYNHARSFEASSFRGLYNFVQYVNEIIEQKRTFAEGGKVSGDGVQIMTIHHSKGLEFPVCFVCDCGYDLTPRDLKEELLFDMDMGASVKFVCDGGLKAENPIRYAMSRNIYINAMLEEFRVLYVALTRARERLIVTGKLRKKTEDFIEECETNSRFLSSHVLLSAKSYIKIIMSTILGKNEDKANILFVDSKGNERTLAQLRAGEYTPSESKVDENEACVSDMGEELSCALDGEDDGGVSDADVKNKEEDEGVGERARELAEEIKRRFEYCYPRQILTTMPAKLSVSRLYPDVLDEGATDVQEMEKDEEKENIPEEIKPIEPHFISCVDSDNSSKRGIATHLFMQFANFDDVKKNGALFELSSLVERGFITQTDADMVYSDELEMFERSEFLSELLSAKTLHRELRFNILLDASEFSRDEENKKALSGEELLVQGVIDCIIEKGDGSYVIVDYKTDRLTDYEKTHKNVAREKLISRHKLQLEYYSLACERIYGKKPDRVMIYSLPLGDVVEL